MSYREHQERQMRDAIYRRVSTKKQADGGLSLDEQERHGRERSAADGHTVVEVYTDVESGSKNDRADYQRLLADAAAKKFDRVIVWRGDRFGRDMVERLTAETALAKLGIEIVSITEGVLNDGDPNSIVMRALRAGLAEAERAEISLRVRGSKAAAVRAGRPSLGRYPLLGYKRVRVGKHLTLVPDSATRPLAVRIFDARAVDRAYRQICKDVMADGILSPTGSKIWSVTTLIKMLENPRYIGLSPVPGFPGEFVETHEGIISRQTWDTVQALRAVETAQQGGGRGRRPGGPALLRGLLRCHGCGAMLKAITDPGHGRRYVCATRSTFGSDVCAGPSIRIEDADRTVAEFWLAYGHDYEASRELVIEQIEQRRVEVKAQYDSASLEAMKLEATLALYDRDYDSGDLPARLYAERREAGEAFLVAARAHVERQQAQLAEVDSLATVDADEAVTAFISALRDTVKSGLGDRENVDAARASLARVFKHFVVEPLLDPATLDPSLGSEWNVTEGMKASGFDLVPVLNDGLETVMAAGIKVPREMSTTSSRSELFLSLAGRIRLEAK